MDRLAPVSRGSDATVRESTNAGLARQDPVDTEPRLNTLPGISPRGTIG